MIVKHDELQKERQQLVQNYFGVNNHIKLKEEDIIQIKLEQKFYKNSNKEMMKLWFWPIMKEI